MNQNAIQNKGSNTTSEEATEEFVPLKGRLYQWVGDHWELMTTFENSEGGTSSQWSPTHW